MFKIVLIFWLIQLQVTVSSFREYQPLFQCKIIQPQKFSFVSLEQPQNIIFNDMKLKNSHYNDDS